MEVAGFRTLVVGVTVVGMRIERCVCGSRELGALRECAGRRRFGVYGGVWFLRGIVRVALGYG